MNQSNDIEEALKLVADTLKKLGVPYYLTGSVASSAYGIARSTLDVDVVSSLRLEHVAQLISSLGAHYYISEQLVRDAILYSSSFNLIHLNTGLKVDIFITKNRSYDRTVIARVREDSLSGTEDGLRFYLASPEDVILSKLEWYKSGGETSQRQWSDILGVLRVQNLKIDIEYLRVWAMRLDVSLLLERVLAER